MTCFHINLGSLGFHSFGFPEKCWLEPFWPQVLQLIRRRLPCWFAGKHQKYFEGQRSFVLHRQEGRNTTQTQKRKSNCTLICLAVKYSLMCVLMTKSCYKSKTLKWDLIHVCFPSFNFLCLMMSSFLFVFDFNMNVFLCRQKLYINTFIKKMWTGWKLCRKVL